MPHDSRSLASPEFQLSFAPSLPRRLLAWVARVALPRSTGEPNGVPLSAQAMLQQILDRHPQARSVFTHLAAVESCLRIGVTKLPAGTLVEQARAELLSIAGADDVQPLLELLAADPHDSPCAPRASATSPRGANVVNTRPPIENLEVHELDEEAYITALIEWEDSRSALPIKE